MNAKEFIKEYGWKEAKRRTEPNMIDMWDAGWGFYTSELKKYVNAYELVQLSKGVDESLHSSALKQAINLIKEI